jgi:hypothetical protein
MAFFPCFFMKCLNDGTGQDPKKHAKNMYSLQSLHFDSFWSHMSPDLACLTLLRCLNQSQLKLTMWLQKPSKCSELFSHTLLKPSSTVRASKLTADGRSVDVWIVPIQRELDTCNFACF